jgi:hypothetical protein
MIIENRSDGARTGRGRQALPRHAAGPDDPRVPEPRDPRAADDLLQRGQADGQIRCDVPADCLLESLLALAARQRSGSHHGQGSEDTSATIVRLFLQVATEPTRSPAHGRTDPPSPQTAESATCPLPPNKRAFPLARETHARDDDQEGRGHSCFSARRSPGAPCGRACSLLSRTTTGGEAVAAFPTAGQVQIRLAGSCGPGPWARGGRGRCR